VSDPMGEWEGGLRRGAAKRGIQFRIESVRALEHAGRRVIPALGVRGGKVSQPIQVSCQMSGAVGHRG